MTTLIPHPVAGHVVPGTSAPFIQVMKPWGWETFQVRPGYITTTPGGPPVQPEPKAQPAPVQPQQHQPKQIGDEHHMGIMHALAKLRRGGGKGPQPIQFGAPGTPATKPQKKQPMSKITEALPGDRSWR